MMKIKEKKIKKCEYECECDRDVNSFTLSDQIVLEDEDDGKRTQCVHISSQTKCSIDELFKYRFSHDVSQLHYYQANARIELEAF